MLRTLTLLVACCFWLVSDGHAEELSSSIKTNLDLITTQPGQIDDFIQHEIDFSVIVTPPYHCKVLKVWLPIPQDDDAQKISARTISTFPMKVTPQINTEPVYGNKFAYFEFHNPKGAQIIRHRFTAKVGTTVWNVDPAKVHKIESWPAYFTPYLKPQAVIDDTAFQQTLATIVPKKLAAGNDLIQVMDWINTNLEYDHSQASLKADANHALSFMRGHCSDFHGLCSTIGRKLGHPTRVAYGLSLYPKNSPSHCKLEAFLPPYGWVSFDLSETQKLIGKIQTDQSLSDSLKAELVSKAQNRMHQGFRENSWLAVTRGTDYQLVPKAIQPVRVVRTIYAEADGQVLQDPDPANASQREFSWMTSHAYKSDKPLTLPFKDYKTLLP
ncbi:MAG: transglutaminase-like domain-containing protein [Pirellulales bacterium]